MFRQGWENSRLASKLHKVINIIKDADEENIWKRNLIYLTFAQFIAMIGMSGVFPFLPLYVRELGMVDAEQARLWSGLVFAGPYFSAVIATPIWGALGDRYGRKLMIQRAIFGLAIAVALTALSQNVYHLFFFRFLQGALSGLIAASLAFVSANTPEKRSGFAIGILQSSIAAGNVVGPFLGGLIADFSGIRYVFLIVSFLCLVSGILITVFVKEVNKPLEDSKNNGIFNNIKYAFNNKNLLTILLLIFMAQAGAVFTIPVFTYFVETLHAPVGYIATVTGLLFGILGLFTIIFSPRWGRRNDLKDWRSTLQISTSAGAGIIAFHIFVPHYLLLFPLRAALGIFYGGIVPTLYSALSKKTPQSNKGGIMGLASASTLSGSLVAFLTSGIIGSALGINAVFIISSILLLSVTILSLKLKFTSETAGSPVKAN